MLPVCRSHKHFDTLIQLESENKVWAYSKLHMTHKRGCQMHSHCGKCSGWSGKGWCLGRHSGGSTHDAYSLVMNTQDN